jgi:hypothetical protein
MQDITKRFSHLSETILDAAIMTFAETLPAPLPDTPENRAARDAAAIEAFVALNPADAAEAKIAEFIVVAELTAAWCERRVMMPDITPELAQRFTRQANSMLKFARESRRYFSKSKPLPRRLRDASLPAPAALTSSDKRAAAAKAERAARIRALDLRLIETPRTMH